MVIFHSYVKLPEGMGFLQIQDDLLGPGPYLGKGMVKDLGDPGGSGFSPCQVASINGKCIH